MISDFVKAAADSRVSEIEAAVHRYRECGVELARFSLMELENGITHLCVDGVPRFSWQAVVYMPDRQPFFEGRWS